MKKSTVLRLTESGVLLAFTVVLSLIPFLKLPFGGSVTLCSMLPVVLIAYRWGTAWGLLCGVANALLQLLTGLDSLQYATSFGAACAIILLDYLLAFVVLGLGGMFRGRLGSQAQEVALGAVVCGLLRYLCHVISGCTVWAGLSIPDTDALIYSIVYNATYMLPEIILTAAGGYVVARLLDFRGDSICRAAPERGTALRAAAAGALILGSAVCVAFLFAAVQGESGFDITGIVNANWLAIGITAAVSVTAAGGCLLASR